MHSYSIPFIDGLDALLGDDEALLSRLSSAAGRGAITFHNWENLFPHHFPSYPLNQHVMFRMAYTRTRLYVYWHMVSDGLTALHDTDLSPVAQDNCMEFFMQPPESDEYWNFEVNALGALNASHRKDRPHPVRLTIDELSEIKRMGTYVGGKAPLRIDANEIVAWHVALAIPLKLVGINGDNPPQSFKGNLYACAGAIDKPYYISLFPIDTPKPDFHRLDFFREILFLR